ncbi:MAG: alpha/beta hydrolase [Actinomycetota bacterium]|nr:alpha/beta hydrolase [Actinomycetota bacterium]
MSTPAGASQVARLVPVRVPRAAEAAVLVLHGGGSRGAPMPVSPTQLSVLRMIPIAHRIARAGRGRLAVWRLLNSVRGWDATHTPVGDVRWALGQLRTQLPSRLPVGLVGHSLGGRAALLAAAENDVRSVVALNPWVYANDGDVDAAGRHVLIVQGTADRIASPARSSETAQRLARTTSVGLIAVDGGKHAMLRRYATFDFLAADYVIATLLDRTPRDGPDGPLTKILSGVPNVTV